MNDQIKKNIEYTLATSAIEGQQPSAYAINSFKKLDSGKIILKDDISAIERKHGVSHTKNDV